MASLVGVVVRHERRIRLRFDIPLRPSAFVSTRFYIVTNRDGRGVSPAVSGALVVGADLHEVELALGADLAPGALYEVHVAGALAADGNYGGRVSALSAGRAVQRSRGTRRRRRSRRAPLRRRSRSRRRGLRRNRRQ